MHVNNKKIENILLNVTLLTFTETFAPKFAVNILVEDIDSEEIINEINLENGGKLFTSEPDSIRIIAPGNAIKKPKAADVPTASYIFFENIVNVGTLKLPPPIPINTDIKPMRKLITKLTILNLGRSLEMIIGSF